MRIFIAARTGAGTRFDAFRPVVDKDQVGGRLGAHELPDATFLCVAPETDTAPADVVDLGSDPDTVLSHPELVAVAPNLQGPIVVAGVELNG